MDRYLQQIFVPEIGISGQNKVIASRILVVGAGGLGTPVAVYLSAMGIGQIGIADADTVAHTNLHRQFLYCNEDIGKNKSETLAAAIGKQNPDIKIITHSAVNTLNADETLKGYDLVCDCTDNAATRLLLDKECHRLSKPLIYGAVRGWQGYVTILNYKAGIRLTDIFTEEELIFETQNNCSVSGIVSTLCGIIGSYQANEALKIILGLNSKLDGSIFCFDGLSNETKTLRLKKHFSE